MIASRERKVYPAAVGERCPVAGCLRRSKQKWILSQPAGVALWCRRCKTMAASWRAGISKAAVQVRMPVQGQIFPRAVSEEFSLLGLRQPKWLLDYPSAYGRVPRRGLPERADLALVKRFYGRSQRSRWMLPSLTRFRPAAFAAARHSSACWREVMGRSIISKSG